MISIYLPYQPITTPHPTSHTIPLSHEHTPSTLPHTLLSQSQEDLPSNVDPLYVDALLAIHSDLFILNPKSTFSWMIYVVRVALALQVTRPLIHPPSILCVISMSSVYVL